MSKTPHCVCHFNSSVIDTSLKLISNEMPSPPLPPRTLKANLSPTKNKWENFPDPSFCNNDKVQCSCNRPHSCPAEEGSPPIPPKCNAQIHRSKFPTNTRFDERLIDDHKRKSDTKTHEPHRSSRKSGRHNSSEGVKTRKKSRSKSRHLLQDDTIQVLRPSEEEKYFMKNRDNLIEKNCEIFYKTDKEFIEGNVNLKLCKISETNDASTMLFPKSNEAVRCVVSTEIHPPDLIPSRTNSAKVTQTSILSTAESSQKSSSKSRMKRFFNFLTKSKKSTDSNRATTITPDALKSVQSPDMSDRPRRSKSLHIISSLSPTTSMHANSNVISPETKTKSAGIFAVISPTTARLKRNLLCISPKASNTQKKQAATLPLVNNSKSILSDNSQQRPGLSSLSGGIRLSPVHLIAGSNSTKKESCCLDNNSNQNHYNVSHYNCGNSAEGCRGHRHRLDMQEKGHVNDIVDSVNKSSSVFKVHHNHSHQDTSQQRKTPHSSNQTTSRPILVNNPMNPMCSCYQYQRSGDTNSPCPCANSAYQHHVCPAQNIVPPCGCMHNIVQITPSHFQCLHGNHNVWCLVPCCPEQVAPKQHPVCSCHHIYHQSGSPPANFSRQLLPPPSPPPPVPSFSNTHQFSRRYRQSYSKTPPPSFHTHHQVPYNEDHCYQEYNLSQKMFLSHQNQAGLYHSNCCSAVQKKQCCRCSHSKCSACGSLFYDEFGSQANHYNVSEMHPNNQCSSTPLSDSVFEQSVMPRTRMFASPINTDDPINFRCMCNHATHRHSETCGRHSTEIRINSCRNSGHRASTQPYGMTEKDRSSGKRRKNSSNSHHDSNVDQEPEDKHDSSWTHHNSPAANLLSTSSMHLSPDPNRSCDSIMPGNNPGANSQNNMSNSINNPLMMSSSIVATQNDLKQHHFEPWRKTFHDNMMALRNLGWYWGPLNYPEAENLVQGRPDGTFLVRDSGNEAYFLSLTFRVLGTTYHTRIEYSQGKFSFWSQPESHSAVTIVEFIDKAVAHSVSGKFHYFLQTNTPGQPPMEVSLLYPLSRYQIVQSLQHLSRFVILSNIRRDHVSQLELPQSIKNYLMEKQYYIDCIDTFVKRTKDSEPLTYEPSASGTRPL